MRAMTINISINMLKLLTRTKGRVGPFIQNIIYIYFILYLLYLTRRWPYQTIVAKVTHITSFSAIVTFYSLLSVVISVVISGISLINCPFPFYVSESLLQPHTQGHKVIHVLYTHVEIYINKIHELKRTNRMKEKLIPYNLYNLFSRATSSFARRCFAQCLA